MELINRVKNLCKIPGVSGCEEAVRQAVAEYVKPYADEIKTDKMGNLLVFKKGSNSEKTCVFAAHMDEVGFIVTNITDSGLLRFDCVGAVDQRLLLGKRMLVGKNQLPGVVEVCPIHLQEGKAGVPKVSDMLINIGAGSRACAESLVTIGDFITYSNPQREYSGWLMSKAIDDRSGCAVLTMLAEKTPAVDTWLCFTVQEEIGTRGAHCAAFALKPDYAYIVENTTAADLAEVPSHKQICSSGGGVVLPFMDKGAIYTKPLHKHLTQLAEKNNITWQTKRLIAGGTDAAAFQRSRAGVPTAGMAVAARSIHSPVSTAKTADIEDMYRLAELAYTTEYTAL